MRMRMRMRGSRVAEDGQRATGGGGLYSTHWAAMSNVGDGAWGLGGSGASQCQRTRCGCRLSSIVCRLSSVVCRLLSVVAGGGPHLTASNDVHAAVANPRTREPANQAGRPTRIDARAAASRPSFTAPTGSPTEANVMVDGRVVRCMHLRCFCIFVFLPSKLRQSARAAGCWLLAAGCMRAP